MSFFGKKMPKKAKQGMVKIVLLILGICTAISMPLLVALGWFASNDVTGATGMQVVAATDAYEILIDRPAERFDPLELDENGQPVYPNISDFKSMLATEGYSLSALSTETAPQLGVELINEAYDSDGGYNLMPGSYGTLRFYIRPYAADGSVLTIPLALGAYANAYDELDNLEIVPVDDSKVLDILNGHLLFFTGRTGAAYADYQYSGLIDQGSFRYDTGAHAKCLTEGKTDCYEITLYWEWPVTYKEILEETSTTSPAVTKKYPPELLEYVAENPERFFATNAESTNPDLLSDGYDDGDQLLADSVDYMVVYIR